MQQLRTCKAAHVSCRDLYHDIAIPGGIAMKSFSEAWANFCKGMDYNDYSMLQAPAKQLLKTISKWVLPRATIFALLLSLCTLRFRTTFGRPCCRS